VTVFPFVSVENIEIPGRGVIVSGTVVGEDSAAKRYFHASHQRKTLR